jgi:hypothetical protein
MTPLASTIKIDFRTSTMWDIMWGHVADQWRSEDGAAMVAQHEIMITTILYNTIGHAIEDGIYETI